MIFLDSNVLVSYFISSAPRHADAAAFLDSALAAGESIAVSPQIVMESFRAMTHEKIFRDRVNAAQFHEVMSDFLSDPALVLVGPGRAAVDCALNAAVDLNISSARIFDLLLYGTMREHGVTRLATLNPRHFTGLDGIELLAVG